MSRVYPTLGSPLSPAEIAVIGLLSDGWTQAEVGHRLGMSQSTVKNHVSSILPRLGAQGITNACVLWERAGPRRRLAS